MKAFVPNADELTDRNRTIAAEIRVGEVSGTPSRSLSVVTCMDSRLDVLAMLGLTAGEAHIIRNAGGVVTDDVIRSLCLSQRYLGTQEVIVVGHSDCGLQKVDEEALGAQLVDELGFKPLWSWGAFDDPFDEVNASLRRLRGSPLIRHKDHIRGFVFDVFDGLLREVLEAD